MATSSTRRTSFPDLSLHLSDDPSHDEYAIETTETSQTRETNHQRNESTSSVNSTTSPHSIKNKSATPSRTTAITSSASPRPIHDPRDHVVTLCPVKSFGTPPPSMCGHSATLVPHTYCMILYGGADSQQIFSDTYLFHIGSQQWERIHIKGSAVSPGALFGHSATLVNKKIYFFGGVTYTATYQFDDKRTISAQDDEHHEQDGKSPRRRRFGNQYAGPITADSVRSSLLAFGKHKESTNRIIALDVDTLQYEKIDTTGTPPSPRYMHSACAVNDKIIIFGGCQEMEYQNTNQQLYVFDTITSTWSEQSTSGTIPSSRHGHSATHIGGGRMLLFGGAYEFDKTQRYNDVYILDTTTWNWSQPTISGSPPLARAFHTAGLLENTNGGEKRLAVFAGETNQVSSDLVVLDVDTFRWTRPLFDGSFEHEMHSSIVVSDKLLIFGGLSYVSGLLDDFFFVNTVTISSGVTENDHTFKLVLVGDSAVGKSCLMTRFVEDRFSDIHLSTIGVDFKTVTTMIDGKIVKLHIWDTAGQERFAQVTTHYYRGADGAILVYDTTSMESFDSIENWVEAVQNANGSTPVSLLLVGNKNDLISQRKVTRESGQSLAEKIKAPFLECSAKDSNNVDVAFLNLAKKLVIERRARKRMASGGGGLKLDSQGGDGRRSCCK